MNGRDMMPACARIAAADPAMADRMWNTTTDDDGRDLVDERMRGKGRVLCAACPMRLDWTGNGVLDRFLEDESLFGEFLRTPVSEGGVESLVVEPPHIVVEVGA